MEIWYDPPRIARFHSLATYLDCVIDWTDWRKVGTDSPEYGVILTFNKPESEVIFRLKYGARI